MAESLDDLLSRFEVAWERLRVLCSADSHAPSHDEIAVAITEAVQSRTHARQMAASQFGGWAGDQHLHVVELRVGALARDLDGFCDDWSAKRLEFIGDDELLNRVRALIVERGVEGQPL